MTSKRFKFFISSNKKKIRYQLLNKEKDLFIIFFHGFMSDITGEKPSTFRNYCRKKKIGFLTFEYSGHGKSSGKFTEGNISKWTNDAKQLIKAKTKNKKKIIFIGSSMGSWIALNLFPVFKKQIKGFIGISSAPEFLEKLMWKKFTIKMKKETIKKGIHIVNVTQCSGGSVIMGRYETSENLKRIGLISGKDITTEAALVKMMYLLGQNISPNLFKTIFETSLRGEMT